VPANAYSAIAHGMAKAHDIVIVDNMSEHGIKALKKVLHGRVSKPKLTQVD